MVAVALGHMLGRTEELWRQGPHVALERAAETLRNLPAPVPRGTPSPAEPAVVGASRMAVWQSSSHTCQRSRPRHCRIFFTVAVCHV